MIILEYFLAKCTISYGTLGFKSKNTTQKVKTKVGHGSQTTKN